MWRACLLPSYAGIHCAYPQRDGQAELIWVASYTSRWFTHLHRLPMLVLRDPVVMQLNYYADRNQHITTKPNP